MCGIVGLCGAQDPSWLTALNRRIVHRGPDDHGEYRDPAAGVSLAMRRLSILDLSGGHQPMGTEDGGCWIVFNGEIYNAGDLRTDLEKQGVRFQTNHSDTEVLLRLYQKEGPSMLKKLNGMFAFVIYDRNRRLLFGARDRLGIKPLYYTEQGGLFAFASELKALLSLPGFRREIDNGSLYHYMSLLYVPGEQSIFQGIRRLPPAHCFTYTLSDKQLKIERYWDFPTEEQQGISVEDWASRIRRQLETAVRRWVISDVPVGYALSGGVDSPALVGLLATQGMRNLKTYSLGFAAPEEQHWDELPRAREVAKRWGTDHQEIILQPGDLLKDLVRMVWFLEEPYGGGLPSWYVFEFMHREVKVGVTGTGGDELFGNYGKFRFLENPWLRTKRGIRKILEPGIHGGSSPTEILLDSVYYLTDPVKKQQIFEKSQVPTEETSRYLSRCWDRSGPGQIRRGIARLDCTTQLPDEFLQMTDRFSMAHSLEARVPYLDHELVELCFQIPAGLRMRSTDPKYLLKMAVRDLLSDSLLSAPKRGFVIPVQRWLREELRPLAEQLLHPDRLKRQGIFRPDFWTTFVRPHLEGRADFTWVVWAGLMFQLWHLIFIEENCSEVPTFEWQSICA